MSVYTSECVYMLCAVCTLFRYLERIMTNAQVFQCDFWWWCRWLLLLLLPPLLVLTMWRKQDECNRIFSANSRVICVSCNAFFVCHLSFGGIVCAIVCVSLHLSLINFSFTTWIAWKFLASTKKKELTFFNWMLRNDENDRNYLENGLLEERNFLIQTWNRNNYSIFFSFYFFFTWRMYWLHFVLCQKIIYFVYGIFMAVNLWPNNGTFRQFISSLLTNNCNKNAAHQLPQCHIERSLSVACCECDYFTSSEMQCNEKQ